MCNLEDQVVLVGLPAVGAPPVWQAALAHGADPALAAWDAGWTVMRPIDADRNGSGALVIRFLVEPVGDDPRPHQRARGRDRDLEIDPGVEPEVRQRLAAYAVVTSSRGLLATEYSGQTSVPGRWGMPGGGIDAGERPRDAVLREVMEETSQTIELGDLVAVQTSHWVGRSPRDTIEDFHAVRLVYSGTCADPSDPVVLDRDGTTRSARWIVLSSWPELRWTVNWRQMLSDLLPAD